MIHDSDSCRQIRGRGLKNGGGREAQGSIWLTKNLRSSASRDPRIVCKDFTLNCPSTVEDQPRICASVVDAQDVG